VLAEALVNPRPMMWHKAWREMLQGVRLEMSLVERRGGEDGLVVGIPSRSSSGSTTGIESVGGFARAVVFLGFLVGLGRRSWMGTCGAVGAVASIVAGLTNTLVGGEVGGLLVWQVAGRLLGWLTSWRIGCFLVLLARRSIVGR
jgi:hypothetical protein